MNIMFNFVLSQKNKIIKKLSYQSHFPFLKWRGIGVRRFPFRSQTGKLIRCRSVWAFPEAWCWCSPPSPDYAIHTFRILRRRKHETRRRYNPAGVCCRSGAWKSCGRGHPRSSLQRKENRNSGRTAQRTEVPCRSIHLPGDIRQKRSRNRLQNGTDAFLPSRPFEPWINGIGPVPRHKDSPHRKPRFRQSETRRLPPYCRNGNTLVIHFVKKGNRLIKYLIPEQLGLWYNAGTKDMREEKDLSGEHLTMPEVNSDSSDSEQEGWPDLLLSMNIRVRRQLQP